MASPLTTTKQEQSGLSMRIAPMESVSLRVPMKS
jgi:hypothetical protein